MTASRVFVAVGPDWGRHPCTLSHVLAIVAREEPVIWINSIAQRSPRLCRRDMVRIWQKALATLRSRSHREFRSPFVIYPRAVPYHQFGPVRSVNGWLLARQLQPVLARFPDSRVILIAANPAAVALVGSLRPDVSIYFCMDDYANMHDSDRALIEICERLMLARANATVVTSKVLFASKTYRGRVPTYIPQGVDFAHFQAPSGVPETLRSIPHPIIGFQGIIGPRVDLKLLEKILQHFPQASLVMIGKVEVSIAALQRYKNFHAVGEVPYEVLPAWAQIFDIGLIAYRCDLHTTSVNPLKLLEYLAMGQAVVSVDLPELAMHRDYVELVTGHDAYMEAIARLLSRCPLSDEERERRRAYAARHDWKERAGQLLALCDRVLDVSSGQKDRDYGILNADRKRTRR
ncbi:MAG: glycosyltransferase [Acidiferrobacter sp.]